MIARHGEELLFCSGLLGDNGRVAPAGDETRSPPASSFVPRVPSDDHLARYQQLPPVPSPSDVAPSLPVALHLDMYNNVQPEITDSEDHRPSTASSSTRTTRSQTRRSSLPNPFTTSTNTSKKRTRDQIDGQEEPEQSQASSNNTRSSTLPKTTATSSKPCDAPEPPATKRSGSLFLSRSVSRCSFPELTIALPLDLAARSQTSPPQASRLPPPQTGKARSAPSRPRLPPLHYLSSPPPVRPPSRRSPLTKARRPSSPRTATPSVPPRQPYPASTRPPHPPKARPKPPPATRERPSNQPPWPRKPSQFALRSSFFSDAYLCYVWLREGVEGSGTSRALVHASVASRTRVDQQLELYRVRQAK